MRAHTGKTPQSTQATQENSFSEQEELMTNGKMPPEFSVKAGPVAESPLDPNPQLSSRGIAKAWEALGLDPEDYAHLDDDLARQLLKISVKFTDSDWLTFFKAFQQNKLESEIPKVYDDFYENLDWLAATDAKLLATIENMPYPTSEGTKRGTIELVRLGEKIGMRAVVPYTGFGGNVILEPKATTTVLGRAVDHTAHEQGYKEAMNQPIGTNYFRYLKDFMVGKNKGGGNVLDVSDSQWSWPLNNAWLQASVDRGDKVRFVSDPTLPTTIFKDGKGQDPTLTVTGKEIGVLIHKDLAPNANGNVESYAVSDDEAMPEGWKAAKKQVVSKGHLNDLDQEAYEFFLDENQVPERAPKNYKSEEGEILATQSNFFGFDGQESTQ